MESSMIDDTQNPLDFWNKFSINCPELVKIAIRALNILVNFG